MGTEPPSSCAGVGSTGCTGPVIPHPTLVNNRPAPAVHPRLLWLEHMALYCAAGWRCAFFCRMLRGSSLRSREMPRRALGGVSRGDSQPRGGSGRGVRMRMRVMPSWQRPLEKEGSREKVMKKDEAHTQCCAGVKSRGSEIWFCALLGQGGDGWP